MANNKLDKFKKLVSQEKSGWLDKAKWRKENEEWLDISFKIAVKVMSALKRNKEIGTFPKNQKELAEALECTPQYVSKLLKGQERLGIDTITKVAKIIGVKLLEVPEEEMKEGIAINEELSLNQFTQTIKSEECVMVTYEFNKQMNKRNNLESIYSELIQASTYVRRSDSHLKVA
ncbi:helix-turn-helix domain-containing protein [Corallibacter sp.]|uniref:helix-turn-helix domain-containing protein n=1 Tax=Corallibacter sp. TaxID=2038084 RepID=UPI003AB69DC8